MAGDRPGILGHPKKQNPRLEGTRVLLGDCREVTDRRLPLSTRGGGHRSSRGNSHGSLSSGVTYVTPVVDHAKKAFRTEPSPRWSSRVVVVQSSSGVLHTSSRLLSIVKRGLTAGPGRVGLHAGQRRRRGPRIGLPCRRHGRLVAARSGTPCFSGRSKCR